MALISAHRCNTLEAIAAALDLGVDYVEFDVHVGADGHVVLAHDRPAPLDAPTLDEALALIGDRAGAHVDLKLNDRLDPPGADIAAVQRVLQTLEIDRVVVTSSDDRCVQRLVQWSERHAPGLKVGLSTSRPYLGAGATARARSRLRSWGPRRRMRISGATVVAAHHRWARWGLGEWSRRRDVPLLVWTVDDSDDLVRWVRDRDTWLVTTNDPALAMTLREDVHD